MSFIGQELYWSPELGPLERWYCRILGAPIIGLRIRLRRLNNHLPTKVTHILDAGCGRGIISRYLATKYPHATVDAVDGDMELQKLNAFIADKLRLKNCHFIAANLLDYLEDQRYDLIVSIDNLEHIADDKKVLDNFYRSLQDDGMAYIHVPHYYRRWPVFRWTVNFDVPGHVRPGYHLPELTERVRRAGFHIDKQGYSYGFLENLSNNISYAITNAQERNKILYALCFPVLNMLAWLGKGSQPAMGAGVWLLARKIEKQAHSPRP